MRKYKPRGKPRGVAPTRRVYLESHGAIDARGRIPIVLKCCDPWGPPILWCAWIDSKTGEVRGRVRPKEQARIARQTRRVREEAKRLGAELAKQGNLALPTSAETGPQQLDLGPLVVPARVVVQ